MQQLVKAPLWWLELIGQYFAGDKDHIICTLKMSTILFIFPSWSAVYRNSVKWGAPILVPFIFCGVLLKSVALLEK